MSRDYEVVGPNPGGPVEAVHMSDLQAGERGVVIESGPHYGTPVLAVNYAGAEEDESEREYIDLHSAVAHFGGEFCGLLCRKLTSTETLQLVGSSGLALLLCCWLAACSVAAPISHQGSTDPATEGWYVMSGVPGYAEDDHWTIATSGYGRYAPVTPLTAADFTTDWYYMAEYRHVAGSTGQMRATLFDGLRGKGYSFTWDGDSAYYYQAGLGDTAIPSITPTEWNTYRLDYDAAAEVATISVNGTDVATLDWFEQNDVAAGNYLFYWGDNIGTAEASEGNWRFVGFNAEPSHVPEPAAVWLLLSGVFALSVLWYPRRRR